MISESASMMLRLATLDDAKTIFDWRNDPWVVARGANQNYVTWDEHMAWLPKALNTTEHLLFIIVVTTEISVGTVRFDRTSKDSAVVSIYVMKAYAHGGLGTLALNLGCKDTFQRWPDLTRIEASIHVDNTVSLRLFSKCGFESDSSSDPDFTMMIRSRPDLSTKNTAGGIKD